MEITAEKIFAGAAALATAAVTFGAAVKLYPEIKEKTVAHTRKALERTKTPPSPIATSVQAI